ncbi:hypothetical protein B620_gp46 [Croceibacter phage P2559S]|uniref:hypothetical protein n=1 Tax=Croceibacter phage P2559S TaxID=1176422 RepID=UPI0002688EC9|nr:hypothetical protein B620_gp46 [Croceibacter phage P2559S]AFM54824.1 hypothetical protein P2559S_46 [Croceibacter phage P2559S]
MAFLNEHTAGDWTYEDYNGNKWEQLIKTKDKTNLIAVINTENDVSRQEAIANAKLIAAAPKMRQLVEMFHDSLEAGFIKDMCVDVLTEAGVQITKRT